jgi:hypothetical protein
MKKINLLEQSQNMQWKWFGQKRTLQSLQINQLNSILKTIENYPNKWYGYSSDEWYNALNMIIRHKTKNEIHKKNMKRANTITNEILKKFSNSSLLKR